MISLRVDDCFLGFVAVPEQVFGTPHHGQNAQGGIDKPHNGCGGGFFVTNDIVICQCFFHAGRFGGIYRLDFIIIVRCFDKGVVVIGVSRIFNGIHHFLAQISGFN